MKPILFRTGFGNFLSPLLFAGTGFSFFIVPPIW
jgi:hypothetical protein